MEYKNLKIEILGIVVGSLHVLILLLLAGIITLAGLKLGLSYEHSTMVALAYLVTDTILSICHKCAPSFLLTALIFLPFLIIYVLRIRKNDPPASAIEIGRAAFEKSKMLRLCSS